MLNIVHFFDHEFGNPDFSDGTPTGHLELVASSVLASEILGSKVRGEWASLQSQKVALPNSRTGLVQRLSKELERGAFKTLEAAEQAVFEAFEEREFLFFWNDEHVVSLNQNLPVLGDNSATFLKIFPLQGG